MDSQQVLRSLVVVLAVISWPPVSCKPAKIMSDGTVDLAQIVRCRLLSDNSGRFVGVGPQNTLHAMGNYEGHYLRFCAYILWYKQSVCGIYMPYRSEAILCM